MRNRKDERLVRVSVAENAMTAQFIRDELAAAGIRSLARNKDAVGVTWGGNLGFPFSIEIFVLEGDAERALTILGEPPPEHLTELPQSSR